MQFFIRTLTGTTITLDMNNNANILDVKRKIAEKEGLPIESQQLILAGNTLEDSKTVADYELQNSEATYLVQRHHVAHVNQTELETEMIANNDVSEDITTSTTSSFDRRVEVYQSQLLFQFLAEIDALYLEQHDIEEYLRAGIFDQISQGVKLPETSPHYLDLMAFNIAHLIREPKYYASLKQTISEKLSALQPSETIPEQQMIDELADYAQQMVNLIINQYKNGNYSPNYESLISTQEIPIAHDLQRGIREALSSVPSNEMAVRSVANVSPTTKNLEEIACTTSTTKKWTASEMNATSTNFSLFKRVGWSIEKRLHPRPEINLLVFTQILSVVEQGCTELEKDDMTKLLLQGVEIDSIEIRKFAHCNPGTVIARTVEEYKKSQEETNSMLTNAQRS